MGRAGLEPATRCLNPKTSVQDPGPYEIQLWRSSICGAQQLVFNRLVVHRARSRFRWPQASPAHRVRNACTFARALSSLPSRASSTVPAPADRCYPRLSARFYCAIRAPSTSVPHLGYTGTYAQVRSREGRKVVYTPTERR